MRNHTILTILISLILKDIPNRSNFNKQYMIPLISLLIVKYVLGDFDTGYQWTLSDIFFVLYIVSLSSIIVAC